MQVSIALLKHGQEVYTSNGLQFIGKPLSHWVVTIRSETMLGTCAVATPLLCLGQGWQIVAFRAQR